MPTNLYRSCRPILKIHVDSGIANHSERKKHKRINLTRFSLTNLFLFQTSVRLITGFTERFIFFYDSYLFMCL